MGIVGSRWEDKDFLSFVQRYPDGAETIWSARVVPIDGTVKGSGTAIDAGGLMMVEGRWRGECEGTFTAVRIQRAEAAPEPQPSPSAQAARARFKRGVSMVAARAMLSKEVRGKGGSSERCFVARRRGATAAAQCAVNHRQLEFGIEKRNSQGQGAATTLTGDETTGARREIPPLPDQLKEQLLQHFGAATDLNRNWVMALVREEHDPAVLRRIYQHEVQHNGLKHRSLETEVDAATELVLPEKPSGGAQTARTKWQ